MGISALLASQILDASATGRSVITGADASAIRSTLGLGTLATQSPTGTPSASTFLRGDFSWQTIDLSGYQPLDSDLTAIAALATTSFGRGLLTETSASTARTTLGLGTLATQSGTFSGTSSGTNTGDQDLSGLLVKASNLSDLTSAATARTNLGLGSGNTPTFLGALLTGGTVTASAPLIDATQTWNSAGTVFTGLRLNVTDTASSSSSLLMDLQVGGVSRLSLRKNNQMLIPFINATTPSYCINSLNTGLSYSAFMYAVHENVTQCAFASGIVTKDNLRFSTSPDTVVADVVLTRDAAQTLAQRNAGNAQTFRVYNTFTDASNYERGKLEWSSNVFRIGTEKAGTGSARALELQTDGTTRVTIASTGAVSMANLSISDSIYLGPSTSPRIRFADYVMLNSGGNWGLLDLSPQTNNQPGTLRIYNNLWSLTNYERLEVLQQHNGNAVLRTAAGGTGTRRNLELDAPALVVTDASNIAVGTTTGTKIGTATTQKLGFYNATPVVQPTAVADATDAASVITQLNALLSRMRDLGLIAT